MGRRVNLSKLDLTGWTTPESIGTAQTAVYVMAGGGMLGKAAAEQPADFYIDARVGRLPYSRGEILRAVSILKAIAEAAGLDPHHMPPMPRCHHLSVF